MTNKYVVAKETDVPVGGRMVVKVRKREIGIFNIGGKLYALPNVCVHQGGPLCRGAISGTLISNAETDWKHQWVHEGAIVVCPWHALEYNITTGQSLAYPNRRLPTYEVRVKDGVIVLRM